MQKTSDVIWQDTQHQVLFELIDKIKEDAREKLIREYCHNRCPKCGEYNTMTAVVVRRGSHVQ